MPQNLASLVCLRPAAMMGCHPTDAEKTMQKQSAYLIEYLELMGLNSVDGSLYSSRKLKS